ncbi:MAG: hypothetical protein SFU86_07205 [Pirellulaceae bacterium]|nr:hypothetical protein [Pirellulaceae bacterium]
MFGQILVEFLFRLTFGIAASMGMTPSRWVTSGFYRVHLWVLLGLQTLAALVVYSSQPASETAVTMHRWQLGLAMAAAALSYVGAVIWMYERNLAGKVAIWLVAGLALAGWAWPVFAATKPILFQLADRFTGGLLLGLVTTAMLLGHWYLNTPTMKLEPLRRLIVYLVAAVVLRALVCGLGTWLEMAGPLDRPAGAQTTWLLFLSLRWLAGILGVLGLAGLTWQTLKIPNTQSATGILYAAVILAFIGELTSQLLSAEARFPL